ncbi:MAG: hypothetical protein FWF30_00165, partial [Coriobacteriia bacterium]|nr:hypothetical protein [Coriobacteriia bacterium]
TFIWAPFVYGAAMIIVSCLVITVRRSSLARADRPDQADLVAPADGPADQAPADSAASRVAEAPADSAASRVAEAPADQTA